MLFRASATQEPELAVSAASDGAAAGRDDIGAYYVQAGPVTFNGLQARVVGGTTWHWGGLTLRYRPNDFMLKSKFGVGVDWPLSLYSTSSHGTARPRARSASAARPTRTGARRAPRRIRCRRSRRRISISHRRALAAQVGLTMAPFPHGAQHDRPRRPSAVLRQRVVRAASVRSAPSTTHRSMSRRRRPPARASSRFRSLHRIVVGTDRRVSRDPLPAAGRQRQRGARQDLRRSPRTRSRRRSSC